MRIAIVLAVLGSFGCSKQNPPSPVPSRTLSDISARNEQAKRDHEKLVSDLKENPQPVVDFALKKAKESFAQTIGDDNMKSATITVDPATLKTFGPEKWTVRGSFDGKDKNGKEKKTTWETEVSIPMGGTTLSAMRVRLEVK